jgi:ATPase
MSKTYIPDLSAIVNSRITKLVREKKLGKCQIIVPNVIVAELKRQADLGRDSGFGGLDELERLRSLSEEGAIEISFAGPRLTMDQEGGEDPSTSIRELVREHDATLITSDAVMAKVGQVEGIKVMHLKPLHVERRPKLIKYFSPNTMSVHLKERVRPMAKIGRPGKFEIKILGEKPLDEEHLRDLSREIIELARQDPDGFIEMECEGASMIQFHEYRIAIARPPFSDGFEITAVRPIVEVKLEDYRLSDRLKARLGKHAEGVLVAGPPGAGKSTFAQALAEFYQKQEKIVKTMESPRDLQVSDEVTQYARLEGEMRKTADLLLLVRPDYTIYDELRKTDDFEIFVDMRFAGVGMVGVVHSTRAIDAVQRLIGRVELGMIPMVVDTVIFIKDGEIRKVYAVRPTVGIPHGMASPDLARPMVEICDFETGEPRYQIYSFGEQVVVMPVKKHELSERERKKAEAIRREVKRQTSANVDVEMLSELDAIIRTRADLIPKIIGRGGHRIENIQRRVGARIDVQEREREPSGESFEVTVHRNGRHLGIDLGKGYAGRDVEIYAGDSFLFKTTAGVRGDIRVKRESKLGEQLTKIARHGVALKAVVL